MRASISGLTLALIAACGFTPSGLAISDDGRPADPDSNPGSDGGNEVDGAPMIDAQPIDAPPLACPSGYAVLGTGTYRLVSQVATWDNARGDCEDDDDGGTTGRTHLVVLRNDLERLGVRASFPGPKVWIGVSDRVTESTWRWVTLEPTGTYPPATGSPWKGGQPNNGGGNEDCAVMEADGDWDDQQCDTDTNAYVCECDAFPEVDAQSDP